MWDYTLKESGSQSGVHSLDPKWGPRALNKQSFETKKWPPFLVHCSFKVQSEAAAVWRWGNFLHSIDSEPSAGWIHINFDETNIKLHPEGRPGLLVSKARQAKRTAAGLARDVPRSKLRGSISHLAMLCDDADAQKMLPQYILMGQASLSAAAFSDVRAAMPPHIRLVRKENAWMTSKMMLRVLRDLAKTLRDHHVNKTVVIYGDVFRAHITREVWRLCAALHFRMACIPAKLTFALQPCDTHLFARYKHYLGKLCEDTVLRGTASCVTVPELLSNVALTISAIMLENDWAKAFRDTGLVGHQRDVSCRVLKKLCLEEPPPFENTLPTLQHLQAIFPKRAIIPIDDVFGAMTRAFPPGIPGVAAARARRLPLVVEVPRPEPEPGMAVAASSTAASSTDAAPVAEQPPDRACGSLRLSSLRRLPSRPRMESLPD